MPLVVEVGGRWRPSVPDFVRRLAKEQVARRPALRTCSDAAASALTARWAARLSALLARGNAAVVRATQTAPVAFVRPWCADAVPLPHSLPEGDCEYDLLCQALYGSDAEDVADALGGPAA